MKYHVNIMNAPIVELRQVSYKLKILYAIHATLVVQLPWALISAESGATVSTSDTSAGDRRSSVILGIFEWIPPTPSVSFSPVSPHS